MCRICVSLRLQELKRPIVGGDMALCENTAWIQELRDQVTMAHVLELSGGQGLLLTSLLSPSYKNALMSRRYFENKDFSQVLLFSSLQRDWMIGCPLKKTKSYSFKKKQKQVERNKLHIVTVLKPVFIPSIDQRVFLFVCLFIEYVSLSLHFKKNLCFWLSTFSNTIQQVTG